MEQENNRFNEGFDLILVISTLHELRLQAILGSDASRYGHAHDDVKGRGIDTRNALNELYERQVEKIKEEIKCRIGELLERKDKISILDIGCGFYPYLEGLPEEIRERLSITLVDKDDISQKNLGIETSFLNFDVLKDIYSMSEGEKCERRPGFLELFFKYVAKNLKSGGCLLLAEFYFPKHLSVKVINDMIAVLRKKVGHGDPLEAFYLPESIDEEACRAGLYMIEQRCFSPVSDKHKKNNDADLLSKRKYFCASYGKCENVEDSTSKLDDVYNVDRLECGIAEDVKKIRKGTSYRLKLELAKGNGNLFDVDIIKKILNVVFCESEENTVEGQQSNDSSSNNDFWRLSDSVDRIDRYWRDFGASVRYKVSDFSYLAAWISISSDLSKLCSSETESCRFDPMDKTSELVCGYFKDDEGVFKLKPEISSFAYNFLLSPKLDVNSSKVCGCSINSLIKRKNEKESRRNDGKLIKSVLFYCADTSVDCGLDMKFLDQRTAIDNLSKSRRGGHYTINCRFNKKGEFEDDGVTGGNEGVKVSLHQFLFGKEKSELKVEERVQYEMLITFIDYLFLGCRNSLDKECKKVIKAFKKRAELRFKKIEKRLYKKYEGYVNEACNRLCDFVKHNTLKKYPSAWMTISLDEPGSEIPTSSAMFFSDGIVGVEFIERWIRPSLRRPLMEYYAVENDVMDDWRNNQLKLSNTKSAIGSIMSRNGSHNIGSHVLAALSHNVGTLPDDRVLYQYIQQRMDYIATVTTDFPTWTQPTMFVADMVKTFLSQRHLLDHIVESEGLKAFQFQNPNIDGEAWFDQHDCVRIHVRKIDSDRSVIEDFIKYNQDNDPIALDKDVALAIPGSIVGEHAFYTILENIIRNAAKHSWTALKQRQRGDDEVEVKYDNLHLYIDFEDKDEKVEFKVYTKLPVNRVVVKRDNNGQLYQELVCQGDLTKWKGKFNELGEIEVGAKSDFDKRPPHYQQQIKLSLDLIKREKLHEWVNKFDQPAGLSPEDQKLFDELPIHFKQQIMLARPFINSEGSLRRENWGMAEMKISAGYLAGRSVEDIGGLGEKKGTNDIIVPYIEHKKEFRCCGSDLKPIDIEENYLSYQFSIAKPKEILIVVEATDGWGTVDARNELKKVGIFVKTVDEIKAEKRLNYRYVVYYDVNTLFDENYQVKDDILLPFRVLSGAKIHDSKKRLRKFIPKIDIGEIQGFAQVLAKALAEEEVTEDAKNNAIQNAKQNIEQLVYTQYLNHIKTEQNKTRKEADEVHNIGLLVAINENEKAGGNSLISDADILELMMEQNFASCVDQYKALMPVDACKKILRPLEIIRNSNSEKCVKFKDRKGATIKQLIAQRLYDWMHQKKKYKDASGKDVSCPVISKNLEIVTHLEEKYSVSRQEEKGKKPFDDPVSALLKQHPIDDFIRYVESVFENTKTLFKQYEEKIVTLPAGYKVQASDVKDGEKFVDGIKIVTSAKETKGDSCHWIGYRRHSHTLPVDATQSLYVEPLSGTQTYLSQLSKVKSDLGLQMRLIENGLMRILVLDERVAKFLREHMAEVGNHYKAMNINVIDDKWVEADNRDVKKADGFFTGYTKDVSTVLENYANANGEQKSKLENELEKIKHKDFSEIDILIVHQGILDKWFEKLKSVEGMKHLLEGFKQLVKYVVVTTGRGTPENIPEEAHLLPFAVVESTLFKKYPEKLILTDTIMNVLPVGKKNNGG